MYVKFIGFIMVLKCFLLMFRISLLPKKSKMQSPSLKL